MSGVWPACTCLVSKAQPAVGSISSVIGGCHSWKWDGGAQGHTNQVWGWFMGNGTWWASTSGFPVSLGPVQRTRACRAAGLRLLNLVNHPGHPTAVGGLPASEPGLDAGTHDR